MGVRLLQRINRFSTLCYTVVVMQKQNMFSTMRGGKNKGGMSTDMSSGSLMGLGKLHPPPPSGDPWNVGSGEAEAGAMGADGDMGTSMDMLMESPDEPQPNIDRNLEAEIEAQNTVEVEDAPWMQDAGYTGPEQRCYTCANFNDDDMCNLYSEQVDPFGGCRAHSNLGIKTLDVSDSEEMETDNEANEVNEADEEELQVA